MKDHSKTGKDEHLGSFAARINDMQEGESEHFETMKIFVLLFFIFFRLSTGFPQRLLWKRIEAGFIVPQGLKEMGLKNFRNTTSREIPVTIYLLKLPETFDHDQ